MKSTGIVRRVDELGRVVIPIELRNKFGIAEKDPIEIYVDGSSIIVEGADNYEIYTEGGLLVPANAELVPGIYIVKVAGQTIKIQVK